MLAPSIGGARRPRNPPDPLRMTISSEGGPLTFDALGTLVVTIKMDIRRDS